VQNDDGQHHRPGNGDLEMKLGDCGLVLLVEIGEFRKFEHRHFHTCSAKNRLLRVDIDEWD
jgi:hypothetical protein